jgi:uncharacterized membrane protein YraQ (UPF0718 family)/copper chaperone CopZ
MMPFLHEVWSVLLELAPWLLVGAAVAGLMHIWLPHDFVQRHLTGKGSVMKAVGLGVPLPLCSCGVIPAGLGLKKDGASDAASMGFLISTPQTGVDSVLVSAAFLGWPFALFKVGSAFLTGLLGGWLTDVAGGPTKPLLSTETGAEPVREEGGLGGLIAHALDLLQAIWGWLSVGVLVSAAISLWVPEAVFLQVGQLGGLTTMLAVLLISLPMYVCATASVPIAAALVAGGMPAGAALVFLMAGPATNVATIGAVHRGFGARVLSIYLGTIILGSIGLGLAFDMVLPEASSVIQAHAHQSTWWAIGSAGVLLLLMARFAAKDLARWWTTRKLKSSPAADAIEVSVGGMTCGGCVSRLEGVLRADPGVEMAAVSLDPGRAVVRGTVDADAVRALVTKAGFTSTA